MSRDTRPPLDWWVDGLLAGAGTGGRALLGITGPPGAGKSWLAARLQRDVEARHGPGTAVVVPMDGFHLANEVLVALARRDRKGAPDTFDVGGLAVVLERLVRRDEPVVRAPRFDRECEETVPDAIGVPLSTRLVIVEGNYLLLDEQPWRRVRASLDEVWYVDTPHDVCIERLRRRQRETYGDDGDRWVERVDRPNMTVVAATRHRADRFVLPSH
jgi:pantothenate kinase